MAFCLIWPPIDERPDGRPYYGHVVGRLARKATGPGSHMRPRVECKSPINHQIVEFNNYMEQPYSSVSRFRFQVGKSVE